MSRFYLKCHDKLSFTFMFVQSYFTLSHWYRMLCLGSRPNNILSREGSAVEDGALQIQTMDHVIVHTAPLTCVQYIILSYCDPSYHSLSYFEEDVGERWSGYEPSQISSLSDKGLPPSHPPISCCITLSPPADNCEQKTISMHDHRPQ